MIRTNFSPAVVIALVLISSGTCVASTSPFATRVVDFHPAPGQNVNITPFNDPNQALCAPTGGGTAAANNSGVLTLGGFGGSITLGFDHPVLNHSPAAWNPLGLDCIVFGNAIFVANNPNRRFAECAVIEIARDDNHNNLADDKFYLIPGAHLPADAQLSFKTWDSDTSNSTYPPSNPTYLPFWAPPSPQIFTTTTYRLPSSFEVSVLTNPNGFGATTEAIRGYADYTPTMVLGDTNNDNISDNFSLTPARFYTTPDDPYVVGITPGSAGGDAFDISWAVDPETGAPANINSFDFIRISTTVDYIAGELLELSAEIDAVADIGDFSNGPWSYMYSDFNRDCKIAVADIFAFLGEWFATFNQSGLNLRADINQDQAVTVADIFAFLNDWFSNF